MSIFTRIAAGLKSRIDPPPPTPSLLERAKDLAAEGRYAAAVDLAAEAGLDERSDDVEAELVSWRRRAFTGLEDVQSRSDWPPRLPNPFPGLTGPPEIDARDLSAQVLGGAILHHGCLIVRGLLDRATAQTFRTGIDAAFAAYDQCWGDPAKAARLPWYQPFPEPLHDGLSEARRFVRSGEGVWTAESPRMLAKVVEAFKTTRVQEAIGGYLGERPAISLGKSTLRRVPVTTGTDWHQDGAFMGVDIRTVNVWLALSPCGIDAPGLDIVARRLNGLVDRGTPGAFFPWSVAPDKAEAAAEGAMIVSPLFDEGDAMLFDQLFLHRTGVRPGMTKTRYAIESWFFAPSAYPAEQTPLLF